MRVVILGTGTNVGKTFVTCRIAESLRGRATVLALKPVETGVLPDEPGDAGAIALAARHAAPLSPWRYPRPVSPHLAAEDVGQQILLEPLLKWVVSCEREAAVPGSALPAITLLESAGGAFSPLSKGATNVALAAALEPALWLLVAPDALGVLHDLTATLRALPRPPDAVILSAARPADESTGSNARQLEALGIASALCTLGRDSTGVENVASWLLEHARNINLAMNE